MGLKAGDSAHFADVLATAASSSNTNVAMMGETFKYAAPLAGTLNTVSRKAKSTAKDTNKSKKEIEKNSKLSILQNC